MRMKSITKYMMYCAVLMAVSYTHLTLPTTIRV